MRLILRPYRFLDRITRRGGFTLIELLTVMAIIAILAGLILSISGFVTKKAALARASAEIQALSAGCESYKTDNGTYPHQPLAVSGSIPAVTGSGSSSNIPSDLLASSSNGNSTANTTTPTPYMNASLELYEALTGDLSCTGTGGGPGVKNYIVGLKPDALGRSNPSSAVSTSNPVQYLSDPFGNSYGYSTAVATAVASGTTSTMGYNPTFDLWCTGGQTANPNTGSAAGAPGDPQLQWIKNW
jgi:prepilin-type N-terminal cleavage/methylation domain-containing protein